MEKSEIKGFIAKRVAQELKDGDVVNLGIGLPTLVPAYLPEGGACDSPVRERHHRHRSQAHARGGRPPL